IAKTISLFNASLELDPRAASPRRELFYFLRAAGDLDAGIEVLKEARRLDPQNGRGILLLVEALRQVDRVAEARQVLAGLGPPLAADPSLRLESARLDMAQGDLAGAAS